MTPLDLFAIILLAAVTAFAVFQGLAAREQRLTAKRELRRAFPVNLTSFTGQVCTATGTAFSRLSESMVGRIPR